MIRSDRKSMVIQITTLHGYVEQKSIPECCEDLKIFQILTYFCLIVCIIMLPSNWLIEQVHE